MAKIHEEIIVIKISRLIKDDQETVSVVNDETLAALEQVTQELVGNGTVVEIEKA